MTGEPTPFDKEAYVAALNGKLVDSLVASGLIHDPRIEAAFRAVPRHHFLPDVPLESVYTDEAIPTKRHEGLAISSSSQPTIMAIMLDQLACLPGDRVLEIGAGTGYNAALLAHLVGAGGQVVSMDIDEDIVITARGRLAEAGAAVQVVCGDGALGYPPAAPYDRIILAVGSSDITPAWIEQLRSNGRLVLPLEIEGSIQKVAAFEWAVDHLESVSVHDGSFMPLRGMQTGPGVRVALGPEPGLNLGLSRRHDLDAEALYVALTSPGMDTAAPRPVRVEELWRGFSLWLATHAPSMCILGATGEIAGKSFVPAILGAGARSRYTVGLQAGNTLCVLARSTGDVLPSDALVVRRFGPDERLAQELIDHLAAWDQAGRPSTTGLRIRAYPRDSVYIPAANDLVIAKEHTTLVLDWGDRVAANSCLGGKNDAP